MRNEIEYQDNSDRSEWEATYTSEVLDGKHGDVVYYQNMTDEEWEIHLLRGYVRYRAQQRALTRARREYANVSDNEVTRA